MRPTNRRTFIKKAALTASVLPLLNYSCIAKSRETANESLSIHIFSKHLQFLDYSAVGQVAAEMGFSGVDLTVRPKGHVLPESVKTNLPKAIQAIKDAGSTCKMITTAVESTDHPLDKEVLHAAAETGVKYYRTNWYKYDSELSMQDSLEKYQKQITALGHFNEELGLVGCYQNHSGKNIGASFWEVHKLLENVNPDHFGVQYDIRHAVAEGGKSWENGLQLLHPHIKTIVLKDFKWGKINGKWTIINTPIGEGMVDFVKYFGLLKKYQLNPPVSLHVEYPIGGAEKGASKITVDKKVVFDAMKKDLNMLQDLWKQA